MNPKVKGGTYEREIAKKLSLWVTNLASDDLFWRSAMSGGRGTLRKSDNAVGDICAIDPRGAKICQELFFECKHLKEASLDSTIRGKGPIYDFWNTAVKQARSHSRFPVLIVKKNNLPDLFITCNMVVSYLQKRPRAIINSNGDGNYTMNVYLLKDILAIKCPKRWKA